MGRRYTEGDVVIVKHPDECDCKNCFTPGMYEYIDKVARITRVHTTGRCSDNGARVGVNGTMYQLDGMISKYGMPYWFIADMIQTPNARE